MEKEVLREYMRKVEDPETTQEELKQIWYSTTSIKLRKGIASHPNASSEILYIAARLYLEEVLKNPGFELISLFSSDTWVNKITLAYKDPDAFIQKYGVRSVSGMSNHLFCRAALLSENLTVRSLENCIVFGCKKSFDMAIKNNPKTLSKLKDLSKTLANQTKEFGTLFNLFCLGLINVIDCVSSLKFFNSERYCTRTLYTKFVRKVNKEYQRAKTEQEKIEIIELIALVLRLSGYSCANYFKSVYKNDLYYEAFPINEIITRLYLNYNTNFPGFKTLHYLMVLMLSGKTYPWMKHDSSLSDSISSLYSFLKENDLLEAFSAGNRSRGVEKFYLEKSNFNEENVEIVKNLPIEQVRFLLESDIISPRIFWRKSLESIISKKQLTQ